MATETRIIGQVISVDPSRVRPFDGQPRQWFGQEALESLEASIRHRGQLQPGLVREIEGDPEHDFELIDGQRRWMACRNLGIPFRAIGVGVVDSEDQFAGLHRLAGARCSGALAGRTLRSESE